MTGKFTPASDFRIASRIENPKLILTILRMWSTGSYDTLDIARILRLSESSVYNTIAYWKAV